MKEMNALPSTMIPRWKEDNSHYASFPRFYRPHFLSPKLFAPTSSMYYYDATELKQTRCHAGAVSELRYKKYPVRKTSSPKRKKGGANCTLLHAENQ